MNLEGFVSASINLGAFDRIRIQLRNPDLRPAWKEARKPLRADQRDHAKRQAEPGGSWEARASSTTAKSGGTTVVRGRGLYSPRRRARRARTLLGRLPTALTTKYDRKRVIVRSLVKWSAIHMEGGRAGHGARIPSRVFLWASDRVLETVSGIVARHLAKVFG